MTKALNILAPTRYPWRFNGPRDSRHNISVRSFLPLNKISQKMEGVTIFNPLPLRPFDLIHAFNRIPIGKTPFVIGFESHLPRAFGWEKTSFFRAMTDRLAGHRCQKIIAISSYARHHFLRQHAGTPHYDALEKKLITSYPNISMPKNSDQFEYKKNAPVRLIFIGGHFVRKGGLAALRIAELAHQRDFSLELHIISSDHIRALSWVDPLRDEFYTPDRKLLTTLPNIFHHGSLPNADVLKLVKNAHFTLLPTFSDSFGFSAIESMANYTPVIATAQGALPEFIQDDINGILLPLDTDDIGEWGHITYADRSCTAYEKIFKEETNRLAMQAFSRIEAISKKPNTYRAMRDNARTCAQTLFSATDANIFWDDLYDKALVQ